MQTQKFILKDLFIKHWFTHNGKLWISVLQNGVLWIYKGRYRVESDIFTEWLIIEDELKRQMPEDVEGRDFENKRDSLIKFLTS